MKIQPRLLWPALFALAVLMGLALFSLYLQSNRQPVLNGGVIDPPKDLPDFTLQSENGLAHLSDFRGRYVLLAFGYTSCPDVCPTVLADLRQAFSRLDAAVTDNFQVIFVSVDYKRDTPGQTAAYVRNFSGAFLGLGGSQAQIDQVTSDYGIYYWLNEPDPETGFYTVDHTAAVFVINPQGQMIMTWPFDLPVEKLAADMKSLAYLNR